MPKPIILIIPQTMHQLYDDFIAGVPVKALLRKYNLAMSAPTLNKLLNTYDIMQQKRNNQHIPITDRIDYRKDYYIIKNSLFPKFPIVNSIMVQPHTYIYIGQWPYGKWEERK